MYTIVRPDMGLESLIQFSRTRDNHVQWIQLLNALDQPDLPGWPLITPIKVQMLKCEKCSREFCSPINYKRHVRIHRRSWKVNKEFHNLRGLLAEFWDKCSLEERKQVISFDDIMLKKTPGSSIINALAGALFEPGIWTFPHVYMKAGSKLLEIIQSSLPITSILSQDLFSILDDASEATFLCTGAAEFVQNYIFDGEAANSLEFKNLVASTCFLFELQLVKAWVADKDAEALKCEKLLVEEEEAARKRQAKLVERRRQKKLRQKVLKVKEQLDAGRRDTGFALAPADEPVSAQESIPSSSSESGSNSGNGTSDIDIFVEPVLSESTESNEVPCEAQIDTSDECFEDPIERPMDSDKDSPAWIRNKVGSKSESFCDNLDHHRVEANNREVVIGSISIPLTSSSHQQHPLPVNARDGDKLEIAENIYFSSTNNVSTPETEVVVLSVVENRGIQIEKCQISSEKCEQLRGDSTFSSVAARELLAQRWKETISGDHVKLHLSPSKLQ